MNINNVYIEFVNKVRCFKSFNRPTINTLDVAHVDLVLQEMAKFHTQKLTKAKTISIQKNPDNIEELVKMLPLVIDFLGVEKEETKKNLQQLKNVFVGKTNPEEFRQYVVQSIGDLKPLNISFHYEINTPISCKLEFNGNGPNRLMVLDVLGFIFSSTDSRTRQKHLKHFVNVYYNFLTEEFENQEQKLNLTLEDLENMVRNSLPAMKINNLFLQLFGTTENLETFLKENSGDLFERLEKSFVLEIVEELEDLVVHPNFFLEDCHEIIKTKLGTVDYQLINYKLESSSIVENYLTDPKWFDIEVEHDGQIKTLRLFAKFLPKGQTQLSLAQDCNAYRKEVFFYRQFSKQVKDLGITVLQEVLAPCYFTRPNDLLIFENMKAVGYETVIPQIPYDLETMQLLVKQLAKFHSASLLYEEFRSKSLGENYRLIDEFHQELEEVNFVVGERSCNKDLETAMAAGDTHIDLFPNPDSKLSQDDFKKKAVLAYEAFYERVKPSEKFRNSICHGDIWATNLLIKFIEGKPKDLRVIDFQMIRYCPPAFDLLVALYLCTDRQIKLSHMDELLGLYYKEMRRIFSVYGVDVDGVYSYDDFIESCEYMMPPAVTNAFLLNNVFLVDNEKMVEYTDDEALLNYVFLKDKTQFIKDIFQIAYRRRLGECVNDFRDMCEKYL